MNTTAQGLRVLITAGAAGIGKAFAETFADAGAKVFVCDVDKAALEAFRAAFGQHPRIIGIGGITAQNAASVIATSGSSEQLTVS